MKMKSVLKLGCAALIATSTMLAPKPAQAAPHTAPLCIYSYTQSDGDVCTYAGTQGRCCVYTSSSGGNCPKICNV
jgi:hypothetical protein